MAIKRRLMAEQWDQFARAVFTGDGYSAVQKEEMRKAFYAGAEAILFRIIQVLAPESEPTEADLQIMSDLNEELQDFGKSVLRKAREEQFHLPDWACSRCQTANRAIRSKCRSCGQARSTPTV